MAVRKVGRAIQWLLTAHILKTLKEEGASRAYADTHEWNDAQLASFKMTAFRPLGMVRVITLLGRQFMDWSEMKIAVPQKASPTHQTERAMARPHER